MTVHGSQALFPAGFRRVHGWMWFNVALSLFTNVLHPNYNNKSFVLDWGFRIGQLDSLFNYLSNYRGLVPVPSLLPFMLS